VSSTFDTATRSLAQRLLHAEPPFISIYLDDSRDSAGASHQMKARWVPLQHRLHEAGIADDLIAAVEDALILSHNSVGSGGRGLIAAGGDVLINERLTIAPNSPMMRASDYPYLLPLIGSGALPANYVFAAVDRNGADITTRQGAVTRCETVEAGGFPVHKPASAGVHAYGDMQHTVEEAIRVNIRAVADRIAEVVSRSDPEQVFVCGAVRARSDVINALPQNVANRVTTLPAGAYGHRATLEEVSAEITEVMQRSHAAALAELFDRFSEERDRRRGLTAEGLSDVCAAIRQGVTATVILGDLGDKTVYAGDSPELIAPDVKTLSGLGGRPVKVARADEALPFAVLAVDSQIVCAEADFEPTDGVCALLRYAAEPTDQLGRRAP